MIWVQSIDSVSAALCFVESMAAEPIYFAENAVAQRLLSSALNTVSMFVAN